MTKRDIQFQTNQYPDFTTIRLFVNDFNIGKAVIKIEGRIAKLADIEIFAAGRRRSLIQKLLGIQPTNRGKGYGTALLTEVIQFCRSQNAEQINGVAVGDIPKLKKWYRSNGFEVDEQNNILMQLPF